MRPLTTEDYRDIWERWKWWFFASWLLVAGGTCLVVALLPPRYQSNSLIILENPEVLQNASRAASTADANAQLQALIQQTLSRTRLEQLVRKTRMVGPNTPVPDSVIYQIQSLIDVKVLTENTLPGAHNGPAYALTVSFQGPTPAIAQEIDNELTGFFVSQKLQSDERAAQGQERALQAELDADSNDLKQKQQLLTAFQQRHPGQLPVDEGLTLQTLTRLEADLQTVEQSLNLLQQPQATAVSAANADPTPGTGDQQLSKLGSELGSLQAKLAGLESRYTAEHPDVIKTKSEIARLQKEIARNSSQGSASSTSSGQRANPGATNSQAANVASRQREAEAKIAALKQQEGSIKKQITALGVNLQAMPLVGQQFDELQRDYKAAKDKLDRDQAKFQDTKLSNALQLESGGGRFRVQDFASLPDTPVWPIRWKINLGGLAGGLLAGVVLILGLEFRDSSVKSERDVEYYLELKTLATVPPLPTLEEINRARRMRALWIFGSLAIALSLSGSLAYLYFLRK